MKTIKFRDYLVKLVQSGEKTSTWRLFDDKDLAVNDEVELINWNTKESFAKALITEVKEKKLSELEESDFDGHEKFESEEKMFEAYRIYYGDKVTPDTIVKMVKFKLLLSEHKYLDPRVRKQTYEHLLEASHNLPVGYTLLIVTAYRPIWMQKELYKRRMKQLAKKHPFKLIFQYSQWKKMVNQYTSPPGGSSHQTGAAVDVTIIDPQGNRLDMGTTLTDFGKKVNTWTDLITDEQKKNRKLLYDVMTKAGFVNYPLEWWHYSYGDRMWAAYTGLEECMYGAIKEK